MVHVAARRRGRAILLEKGNPLMAGMHEHLPVGIPVHRHPQNVGVEFLGFLRVLDMQHDVIDSTGRYHRVLPQRLRIPDIGPIAVRCNDGPIVESFYSGCITFQVRTSVCAPALFTTGRARVNSASLIASAQRAAIAARISAFRSGR